MARCMLFLVVIWSFAVVVQADDAVAQYWHQWRGPDATGAAPLGDPPTKWDEQTNIKWKVPIPGKGNGTPIIWGDRIFLMTAIKTDREAEPPQNEAAEDSPIDRPPVRLVAFADDCHRSRHSASRRQAQAIRPRPQTRTGSTTGRRCAGWSRRTWGRAWASRHPNHRPIITNSW